MRLTNSKQMKIADDKAIHVLGMPSTWLMTNAAEHIAKTARRMMGENRSAVIFCGSGNNGGDGIAAAIYLMMRGVDSRVLLVGERARMTPDALEMQRRLTELGGSLEDFDPADLSLLGRLNQSGVIIDAIFGIGLSRSLEGKALDAVRLINESTAPVVSADIASGVDADTGKILGEAVFATATVTFSMAKPGHFVEPGCIHCGELYTVDIGIAHELLEAAGCGINAVVSRETTLPRREKISHKGDYGRLLIVGGSVGYTGAPNLCAAAAVKSGAGLVFLGVPSEIYEITAVKNDEAMPFPLASKDGRLVYNALPVISPRLQNCDAIVLGPGLGRSEELTRLVCELVRECPCPVVADADALYALSHDLDAVKNSRKPVILTPHGGEFERLGGVLSGDRIGDARRFSQEHGCVLVLKGHRTICAFPDGEVYIISAGNPGMAKGGSGDVLAGILGAMLCQLPLKQAVVSGCWLHARAGDLAADALGEYSMTATDIIAALSAATIEATQKGMVIK